MSSNVPIGSTLVSIGNNTLGQFTGISVGKGLKATSQGSVIHLERNDDDDDNRCKKKQCCNNANNNPYLNQPEWHINAITGNDSNNGKTASTALKTHAEFQCRIGLGMPIVRGAPFPAAAGGPLTTVTTVFIDSNLPSSDAINLYCNILQDNGEGSPGVYYDNVMNYIGKKTVLATGTIAAGAGSVVNAFSSGPNQATEIRSINVVLANFLGKRLRVTGGPNAGQIVWITKDLGANFVRTSLPFDVESQDPTLWFPSMGVLSPGDPFVIEELCHVVMGNTQMTATGATPGLVMNDFYWTGGVQPFIGLGGNVFITFKACDMGFYTDLGASSISGYTNCHFSSGGTAGLGIPWIVGGVLDKNDPLGLGAQFNFSILNFHGPAFIFDFTLQDVDAIVTQELTEFINTLGCFDSTSPNVLDSTGGTPGGAGARYGTIYGTNNLSPLMAVGPGSSVKYDFTPTAVTLTPGVDGDFTLSRSVTGRSWDETAAAYVGGAPIPCTWAKLALPIGVPGPGTGFGDDAHNVGKDSHLIKSVP